MNINDNCHRIHRILSILPLYKSPKDVPFDNGLYFFYEKGEISKHSPRGRVVRIGNHPYSQNNLKGRLWNHYSGGKNGSVFRKFLGGALIRRNNPRDPCLKHWEKQDSSACPRCRPIEKKVSELLRNKFSFRSIKIKNKELRNKMEKIIIATISSCSVCNKPTRKWLGHYAYSDKVRSSGLWNSDYANEKSYIITKTQLAKLEQFVRLTLRIVNRKIH